MATELESSPGIRQGEKKINVLRILDEIEELVETSARIPMTGKVLLDDEILLDYLDRIRTGLPEELRQAKWLTKERQRLLQDAESESQRIIEEARVYVAKMAAESEIAREARAQAEEIIAQARKEAKELRLGAREYADDMLKQMEHSLGKSLQAVKKGREELQMFQDHSGEEV